MSKYFTDKETLCKCGCGLNVKHALLGRLDYARFKAGVPFIITSGARCLEHNRKIGSKDTSSHVKGLAVDIAFKNSYTKFKIIKGLIDAGFTRIGINDKLSFIHVDMDEDKPQEVMFKY